MKFYLESGFNLLVYGFGSKWAILNDFVQTHLEFKETVVFNGYHNQINVKMVFKEILNFISVHSQMSHIADMKNKPIYEQF